MDLGLNNKVALVAAGSQGLGKAVACELAREGARVAICGRGQAALEAAASEVQSETGRPVLTISADLAEENGAQRFVSAAAEHYGGVDILVVNAGGPPPGDFLDLDPAAWERGVQITLMSAVRLCYAAIPHMRRAGGGRIIAITSMSVKQPLPNLALSNSIRAAVVGMTKTLSNELAAENILVNAVLPGWTATERVQQLIASRSAKRGLSPEQIEAEILADIPMRRMGTPEEFATVVTFLASARASYVTGTAIAIDGGRIQSPF